MSEGRYTELFFLDEAVAFAAGHRPCAECRRKRYDAFKNAWWSHCKQERPPFAEKMDLELHPARIDRRKKVTYGAALSSLPDGSFVLVEGCAHLVWRDALLLWTPEGYARKYPRPEDFVVTDVSQIAWESANQSDATGDQAAMPKIRWMNWT
jgi:hypothetical protein